MNHSKLASTSHWLNEKRSDARLLLIVILLVAPVVATCSAMLIRQALPASEGTKTLVEPTGIEKAFAPCDDAGRGARSHVGHGHRYHLVAPTDGLVRPLIRQPVCDKASVRTGSVVPKDITPPTAYPL